MEFWGRHRHVMGKSGNWWENLKIGGGAASIETGEGWLLFYHSVTGTCNGYVYSIGGAILDLDEPSRVLHRCGTFLLTPEKWYEERGFVPNVCFPCATFQDADTGCIAVYYGCADSYVGLAFTTADEVVGYIKIHDQTGEAEALALALAEELFEIIESRCADEGGYLEAFTRDFRPAPNEKLSENGVMAQRTMNTLLHVFEGYAGLYQAKKLPRTASAMRRILDIYADKVYNPLLCRQEVFFDETYRSLIDLTSYGHDIESSWLID